MSENTINGEPLQFGNKEQIAFMKKQSAKMKGLVPVSSAEESGWEINFTCIIQSCRTRIEAIITTDEYEYDDWRHKCKCGLEYRIEFGDIFVKQPE